MIDRRKEDIPVAVERRRRGRPVTGQMERFDTRLPAEDIDKLDQCALRHRTTRHDLLRRILRIYFLSVDKSTAP
jgi:hypothetical protein